MPPATACSSFAGALHLRSLATRKFELQTLTALSSQTLCTELPLEHALLLVVCCFFRATKRSQLSGAELQRRPDFARTIISRRVKMGIRRFAFSYATSAAFTVPVLMLTSMYIIIRLQEEQDEHGQVK